MDEKGGLRLEFYGGTGLELGLFGSVFEEYVYPDVPRVIVSVSLPW